MTREEFIRKWSKNLFPHFVYHDVKADLDLLLAATESAARKAALEEAWNIADAHECVPMGGCRCQGHIMDEIRKAQKQ